MSRQVPFYTPTQGPTQISHLDAILRQDFAAFNERCFLELHGTRLEPAWHIEAMCHAVEKVWNGSTRRLMINVPPRYLKSETISIAFVAWALGHNPKLKILVATYGAALSAEHARQFRKIVQSSWYQRMFPHMRLDTPNQELIQTTTAGGCRRAISPGGSTTGFGADIIICDDIMKAGDASSAAALQAVRDFYDNTLVSRLNDKRNGPIIVLQQRIHIEDFAAHALEKGNFERLILRAIAQEEETFALTHGRFKHRVPGEALCPYREPLDVLEDLRREMGDYAFSAQYLQDPEAQGGSLVPWSCVQFFDEAPPREDLLRIVQSWDTATSVQPTADWSVCTTWGLTKTGVWLLLDLYRDRLEYPDLKAKVIAMRAQWGAHKVIIEEDGVGRALCQELRRAKHGLYLPVSVGNKEDRWIAQSAKMSEGLVLFPRQAAWLDGLRREFALFGTGAGHDDQIDSISHFLASFVLTRMGNTMRDAALAGVSPDRDNRHLVRRPAMSHRNIVRRQSMRS